MNDTFYYLLGENTTQDDLDKEIHHLGVIVYPKKYLKNKGSFYRQTIFYKKYGFHVLEAMITSNHPKLQTIKIKNSNNKELTIEQFFDCVSQVDFIKDEN